MQQLRYAPARAEAPESELLSAVRALPPAYSAVLHLHYYEGYSIKEIAALLRLPAATDEDLDQLCCHYTLTIRGRDRAEE